MSVLRTVLVTTTLIASAAAFPDASTADNTATHGTGAARHTIIAADQVRWMAAPPGLPKGTEQAVLAGDPSKPGLFILRARIPDGTSIAPHWHSQAEHITVLQGSFHIGHGATFDRTKTTPVTAGGFLSMPARMQHFVWVEGQTIIEVTANGPFDIVYVNPQDDPAKQAMK
jgi:hypothetical protein